MDASKKPIEQFFESCPSNMEMLYEAMPYVSFSLKKPLALYIKIQEMREIMEGFDDSETLSACGLNENSNNIEDMILAMRKKANGLSAKQLDMILNIMQATKIFRTYQELSKLPEKNNPFYSNSNSSVEQEESTKDLLSKILPLLLNNPNAKNISSRELTDMIENAMKGESYEPELA